MIRTEMENGNPVANSSFSDIRYAAGEPDPTHSEAKYYYYHF